MAINEWSFFCTPYDRRQVKGNVPSEPGVYCIWVRTGAGRWECFYVGKTENLRSRLLDHLSDQEPNACFQWLLNYTCGVFWMEVPSGEDRGGIEKYLFDVLDPACNTKDPGGTALVIALPRFPI